MKPLRILLTNDDGVLAPGIQALREGLERLDGIDLTVIAPDRPRSASGQGITLHKPLHRKSLRIPGARSPVWSVNGTPVDCAKIGICSLTSQPPDVVISGINSGANLGQNLLYSGTVCAAIEGALHDIPSIAVSLACAEDEEPTHQDFQGAVSFMVRFVASYLRRGLPRFRLLNINVPPGPLEELKGVSVTRLSRGRFFDDFEARKDPRGRTYYWMAGELHQEPEEASDPETDAGALRNRKISVTPLRLELSDLKAIPMLRKELEDLDISEAPKGS